MSEMAPIQDEGINYLLNYSLVSKNIKSDSLLITEMTPPKSINELIQRKLSEDSEILDLLVNEFNTIDLYGHNGLKHRSQLFEYRYDSV